MQTDLQYVEIQGIKCFNPEVLEDYSNYPEFGFDAIDQNEQSDFFWTKSRLRFFKYLLYKYHPRKETMDLLEVGCGEGGFARQLYKDKKFNITISDIYLKSLLISRERLPDINYIQYDVTGGTLNQKFDIITLQDVLEHIEDDKRAMNNLFKMLNPDGILLISVP